MTTVLDPASGVPTRLSNVRASALTYAPLSHDLDVDVCVIGGGLAGITVARELVRRGWSVAVLEAKRVAWNASGRNAGFVLPGFAEDLDAIVDRVGVAHARQLWALSVKGVEYVRSAVRELRMPGADSGEGFLKVSLSDTVDKLQRRASRLRDEFGTPVELWSTDRVRAVLQTDRYFQALHWPHAFHLHPLTYALALASKAEQSGARIFEETPAVALDVSGVRKRVDTPAARVRAHHVVLAGGAHLGSLFAANSGTVMPIVSYLAATVPLGERLGQAIRYSGGVADMRLGGDHYRAVHGGRLLWGGGISTRTSVPPGLGQRIARRIREIYPQLGTVNVTYTVSGVMGYAVHKMPQIGEIASGVWLASAFGGQGLNTTAMAGELIAGAIADGDDRWRLFAPYELVWAGGTLGRVAAQCLLWAAEGRHRAWRALRRDRRGDRLSTGNVLLRDLTEENPISVASADLSIKPRSPSAPDELTQSVTRGAGVDAARSPEATVPTGGGRTPQRRVAPRSGPRRTARSATHRTRER
jgi:glycine/D-amino acid oxidase-like deaminating enzyme